MKTIFITGASAGLGKATAIAEVVYQAATDEKDQLTYPAGKDAVRLYAKRLAEGPEAYRILDEALYKIGLQPFFCLPRLITNHHHEKKLNPLVAIYSIGH